MKEYNRLILWLDYFNSELSRSQGRRVPLSRAIRSPVLKELVDAAARAGYRAEPFQAKHPKRVWRQSGYVSVEKVKGKGSVLKDVSLQLGFVRGTERR